MQNQIFNLDDKSPLERTREAVQNERKATTAVLHHLREIDRRKLFADSGHASLFEYCVRELGYSESSAQRRISSMRLLKELPEIEEKIESGILSLSVVSQAQTFFKQEARVATGLSTSEKRELLALLENKSAREAERTLLAQSSAPAAMTRETVRAITEDLSELKFVANEELLRDLERLKGLLAHSHPDMTLAELVQYMATQTLAKLDPAREPKRAKKSQAVPEPEKSLPTPAVESRRPSAQMTREIWRRDQAQCSFTDASGKRCGSVHALPYYSPQVIRHQ